MNTISSGGADLASGITAYGQGVSQIADSTIEIRNGTFALSTQGGTILSGIDELKSGTTEFKNGLEEFRDEGITELTDFVQGDLASLKDRMNGLKRIYADYTSYSGGDSDVKSSVVYMLETDSIKK